MTIPCMICGGACGAVYERAVMDSNDRGVAHWIGGCKFPREEHERLARENFQRTLAAEKELDRIEEEQKKQEMERARLNEERAEARRAEERRQSMPKQHPAAEMVPSPPSSSLAFAYRAILRLRPGTRARLEATLAFVRASVDDARRGAEEARASLASAAYGEATSEAKSSVRFASRLDSAYAAVDPTAYASPGALCDALEDILARTWFDDAEEYPEVVVSRVRRAIAQARRRGA